MSKLKNKLENTILFGNGINRLNSSNISWRDVLNQIKGSRKFKDNTLPNTMIYERVILEKPNIHKNILLDEFDVKKNIANLMESIDENRLYSEMYDLNVQHYLTTNYDYSFINSIVAREDINSPIYEYGTEDVYSIRRMKRISNLQQQKKHFWQIHGEIKKPATIMLGLDHYCGSIGKIDGYIKGRYTYSINKELIKEKSIEEKFETKSFNNSSWIELFFTTNVHIFGITLDYAEIDLWWILNKRARMKKNNLKDFITNDITIYVSNIDEQKMALLDIMDINVEIIPLSNLEIRYIEFYNTLFKKLNKRIKVS